MTGRGHLYDHFNDFGCGEVFILYEALCYDVTGAINGLQKSSFKIEVELDSYVSENLLCM